MPPRRFHNHRVYAHLSENATRRAVDLIDFNSQSFGNIRVNSVENEQKLN